MQHQVTSMVNLDLHLSSAECGDLGNLIHRKISAQATTAGSLNHRAHGSDLPTRHRAGFHDIECQNVMKVISVTLQALVPRLDLVYILGGPTAKYYGTEERLQGWFSEFSKAPTIKMRPRLRKPPSARRQKAAANISTHSQGYRERAKFKERGNEEEKPPLDGGGYRSDSIEATAKAAAEEQPVAALDAYIPFIQVIVELRDSGKIGRVYGQLYKKQDFRLGNIVSFPFTEPLYFDPSAKIGSSEFITQTEYGKVFTKIRKFVVISRFANHFVGLPIYTHGNKGLKNKDAASKLEYVGKGALRRSPGLGKPGQALSYQQIRDAQYHKPSPSDVNEPNLYTNPLNSIVFKKNDPRVINRHSYVHIRRPTSVIYRTFCIIEYSSRSPPHQTDRPIQQEANCR
ncbi:unnamed protein product [Diplocarpon coronariae]